MVTKGLREAPEEAPAEPRSRSVEEPRPGLRRHKRASRPNKREVPRERQEAARARGRSIGHIEIAEEKLPGWLAEAMAGVMRRARIGAVPALVLRPPRYTDSLEGAVLCIYIADAAVVLENDDPSPEC